MCVLDSWFNITTSCDATEWLSGKLDDELCPGIISITVVTPGSRISLDEPLRLAHAATFTPGRNGPKLKANGTVSTERELGFEKIERFPTLNS